jgi:type II secretory pathway pseudopilin PulG
VDEEEACLKLGIPQARNGVTEMGTQEKRRQGGFSLVELMVAMMATLIVSGAIFGLLAGGNNVFRREPELSDRQENIRVAMNMITRDVVTAGGGMNSFVQAFTNTDAGGTPLNNPPLGSVPSALVAGENADFLEIIANDGTCPNLTVCGPPSSSIATNEPIPACYGASSLTYVYGAGGPAPSQGPWGLLVLNQGAPVLPCNGLFNAPAGGLTPAAGACSPATTCQFVSRVNLVRYQIAPDPDDPQTPSLWRSPMGRVGAAPQPPNFPWQVVAKGIEDLQVRYLTGAGWADSAGVVTAGVYGTIVREVQITLSARSMAPHLAGQMTSAVGSAVRGQLVSVVSPRAAQLALQQGDSWK